MEYKV